MLGCELDALRWDMVLLNTVKNVQVSWKKGIFIDQLID
jgi:hypothetical protein